ncbi:hypothetical protein BGX24_011112 [Mortierella sp. AD032]|nr:hypothetical protein BGX24_011112 [Mortierella sp. AD032]
MTQPNPASPSPILRYASGPIPTTLTIPHTRHTIPSTSTLANFVILLFSTNNCKYNHNNITLGIIPKPLSQSLSTQTPGALLFLVRPIKTQDTPGQET